MKTFTNTGNASSYDLVHMKGDKDKYTITESNGKLTYTSIDLDRTYILDLVEEMGFKYSNGVSDKFKWDEEFTPFEDPTINVDGGGWTIFASNSSLLTGTAASAGAIDSGTVGFKTTDIGTSDITNETWTDLATIGLNSDGSVKFWIAYTNITNTNEIKTELLDFNGETSPSTAQTTFGHAEIRTWNGTQSQNFTTEGAVFEIHHGGWDANSATNWILSEKARTAGNGLVNNWAITSHGRRCSINGVEHTIDPNNNEVTLLVYR